jgi:hypothetical protein
MPDQLAPALDAPRRRAWSAAAALGVLAGACAERVRFAGVEVGILLLGAAVVGLAVAGEARRRPESGRRLDAHAWAACAACASGLLGVFVYPLPRIFAIVVFALTLWSVVAPASPAAVVAEDGDPVRARRRRVFRAVVFLACLAPFAGLELWARARHARPGPPRRFLELAKQLPAAEAEQFLADRAGIDELEMSYFDYHVYSCPPYRSKTVNFTDYFSSRLVPDGAPLGQSKTIVWMFGGSTMQNLEAPDELTISNVVARELRSKGVVATVVNFGVGSFHSSLEAVKFLDLVRRVPAAERPAVVVFYDGFNDPVWSYYAGPANMQEDFSRKLEAVVKKRHRRLAAYALSETLGRWSVYWHDNLQQGVARWCFRLGSSPPDGSDENLARAVSVYETNARAVRGACRELGIRPVFVLQPLVVTKTGLSKAEEEVLEEQPREVRDFTVRFYRAAAKLDLPELADLSHVLDGDRATDFWDLGHTGPFTGKVTGAAIAERVKAALGP